jgi:hypothetical protein
MDHDPILHFWPFAKNAAASIEKSRSFLSRLFSLPAGNHVWIDIELSLDLSLAYTRLIRQGRVWGHAP